MLVNSSSVTGWLIVLLCSVCVSHQQSVTTLATPTTVTSANIKDGPSLEYAPKAGTEPASPLAYSMAKNVGGIPKSPTACQCVPMNQCPSYNGNGGGGGNIPESPVPLPSPSVNIPESAPAPPGASKPQGPTQGGIIPINGQQSGNANIPESPKPNTDGSGMLDLRIVNRPPRPGGVQCLNGQIYCCDLGNPNPTPPGGQDAYSSCGTRSVMNIPGKSLEYGDAKFGAYPWMAVILGKRNDYIGAAALISPYFVLTAAHKITAMRPGTAMKVRFGEWNAKDDDEPYKNVEIDVAEVIMHPGFNSQNLQNDIALVRLASPIDTLSFPHIKQVCLPRPGFQYAGQRCWVAGFGRDAFGNGKHSYVMKEVDLPILDNIDCEKRLRTTRLGRYFELNKKSFVCAGGEEGKDACTGDGGSPLVCETGKGGTFEVLGLVAWGIGCAEMGIPGVYVNVPNYVDWIVQQIYK